MVKALHSGGGRTHVEVGQKTAPNSRNKVNVGKVSALGQHRVMAPGSEASGPLLTSIRPMPGAPQHGNTVADATVAGPGGSRTVRPSGHQGLHSGKSEPAHPMSRPSQTSTDPMAGYPGKGGR
jgi:hypothetical protein